MKKNALHQCLICGLHYRDEATAKACYEFCKKHNACSMEITKAAVENEQSAEVNSES